MSIEQINSGGTVIYLHHDQQGSTRLITGSTGKSEGKCTYSAYGGVDISIIGDPDGWLEAPDVEAPCPYGRNRSCRFDKP